MEGLRAMIASAVVIGLMLSSVGTALAEEPTETTANVFGKVIAKDQASSTEGFVELSTKQGNVKVKVATNTQHKNGAFGDIVVGSRVALVADRADGVLVARKVLVVPSEPTYLHLVGVVTSASETTATVSISDKQGAGKATFTIAPQPTSAAPTPVPAVPGQYVTAVVSKDLRAMKFMIVRVAPITGQAEVPPREVPQPTEVTPAKVEPTEATPIKVGPTKVAPATGKAEVPPTEATPSVTSAKAETSTRAIAKVTCIEMSPELVKQVCIATPSEVSRGTFMDMPPDRVMEVWKNVPPELAKEIWMSLPPVLARERWMNLPPETKKIWIDLPPELAAEEIWLDINSEQLKQIWLNMPPQLAKEILRDMSPDLVKDVWIHIPPEQIKQIWMHLPAQDVKQIWMEMPTPTEATESSAGGGASAGKVESISVQPMQAKPVRAVEKLKGKEAEK